MQKTVSDVFGEVRAVYLELAKRPLQRNCIARTECCQFQLTGLTPHFTKGEALLAAKAFRATGRKALPENDGICPMLNRATGRCMIYADRPFGCRTHFCEAAGGPYARKEVLDLIRRLEDLDVKLKGDGPRKIFAALADALAGQQRFETHGQDAVPLPILSWQDAVCGMRVRPFDGGFRT